MVITKSHSSITRSQEFAELCKPLALFNIHHVTYMKQFNDGSRFSLSNKPQWLLDYYNLHLYDTSLFEKKPSEYEPDVGIWIGEYDLDVYQHGKLYYNTYHSITITEPVEDGCEFYLFSTSKEHAQAIQYLANHLDVLYHFILFIKDRGIDLFTTKKQDRFWLPDNKLEISAKPDYVNPDYYEILLNMKNQFYEDTPIRRYAFHLDKDLKVQLSQRELHCIGHFLKNKSAVQIAEAMNVGKRTVESHLDNIKSKLQCRTKSELTEILRGNRLIQSICSYLDE